MTNKPTLSIVQLNDSHAYLNLHQELFWEADKAVYRPVGGYARIATIIRQIRSENEGRVLFCDCGDTLHGTYAALQTQGQALIPILNELEFDAMSSHWEFAYSPATFKQLAAQLSYPTLAINVYDKATKKLIFPPYRVKEVGGIRIGMIGIASNIIDKTMPPSFSEGVRFTLGREELPTFVDILRMKEKVDLIVLISHLGFAQDMKLLSEVDGIDVCLSGHTHNRLHKPVLQGKTLVIQSGCHGSFLGRLDVEVQEGKIVDYRHQLIEVEESIKADPVVEKMVRKALSPFQEELSQVVGETKTALNRSTMLESTMDNFLLQALMESTGSEMAFSNGWRYGAPVVPGKVTLNDLYNIIPMNPPVSTVNITGEELLAMLEENLERTFASDPYEQMGGYVKRSLGLTVYLKIENPKGQRIQQVFVGKEELDPKRTYYVAFVTEQGVAGKYGSQRKAHPEHAIDAMLSYLAKHRPMSAELRNTFVAV
ncbi:MAG: bifunctional metallophosphatase/5'-nucleotidase [Spirochaetia bacterium]|nr:bifunctional metallophosphatase/5'-nucleotidase [Spirochaetia bacterium]